LLWIYGNPMRYIAHVLSIGLRLVDFNAQMLRVDSRRFEPGRYFLLLDLQLGKFSLPVHSRCFKTLLFIEYSRLGTRLAKPNPCS
jgi:hypothetical protein